MRVDVFHPRKIPFVYVSPPVCDFIFSASSTTEIFLSDRDRVGRISGFTISYVDGVFRLQWDTYPGALCYSVYKLVDELDPFSGYILVAECVEDTFFDTTDPGVYAVTPITPEGEGGYSDPVPTPEIPGGGGGPAPCEAETPTFSIPNLSTCDDTPLVIDVVDYITVGDVQTWTVTQASVDQGGTVSFTGSTITFTPTPAFSGPVVLSYTVEGNCEASYVSSGNITVECAGCTYFDAIGAWSDASTAQGACLGGTASASGLNNVATCSATAGGYFNPLFPPACSPSQSNAKATYTDPAYTGDAVDCRCTVDISGASGFNVVKLKVTLGVSTLIDTSTGPYTGASTEIIDFTIPATVSPTQLTVECHVFAGRDNIPIFTVEAGTIDAQFTFGDVP